jgi:hypothetical protein
MAPLDDGGRASSGYGPDRLDTLFDVMSHRRRRTALRYLRDAGEPVPVLDLARHLADSEGAASGRSAPASRYDAMRTALEHQHLPKLAHADLVEWDRRADVVEATELAARADDIMTYAEEVARGPGHASAGGTVGTGGV